MDTRNSSDGARIEVRVETGLVRAGFVSGFDGKVKAVSSACVLPVFMEVKRKDGAR